MLLKTGRGMPPRRRPKILAVVLSAALVTALVSLAGLSPASADRKAVSVGDEILYSDGSPASGVRVTVFEAVNHWQRGSFLGSVSTNNDGKFNFDVAPGCFITVAIAPLGAEFDSPGSGKFYDQIFGCAENGPNNSFDSVLYREDTKPSPPTTQPPTTQPPTTQPPNPPVTIRACVHWINQGRVRLGDPSVDRSARNISIVTDTGEQLRLRWWVPGSGQSYHTSPRNGAEFLGLTKRNAAAIQWIDVDDGRTKPYRVHCGKKSPIGVDIDGSGSVERVDVSVQIDIDADGTDDVLTEWFAPTEGILVQNVDGAITGRHLFGDQAGLFANGFEKLALRDANGDGQVAGPELVGLEIWTDANSNAMLDVGELSKLEQHQIASLSTSHTNFVSSAGLADGSTMVTEDLWFSTTTQIPARRSTTSMVLLGFTGLGLLGFSIAGSWRRRRFLDDELAELLREQENVG